MIDPLTKKITISRDVVFEENEGWDWSSTKEETINDVLDWGEAYEEVYNQNDDESDLNDEDSADGNSISSDAADFSNDEAAAPQTWERKALTYLDDYTSGEGLSEDDVQNFVLFLSTDDPLSYEQAVKSKDWRKAMDLEIEAIEKNHTWKLVKAHSGVKVIGVKWVYRTKLNKNGEIDKCKARLVAKGYVREKGIDYNEVFTPVAKWDTIRMVLALVARNGWKIFQLDVKSAFLHGELSEDVYVANHKVMKWREKKTKCTNWRRLSTA